MNEKEREEIRKLAFQGKVKFAPDDQIGYLRSYIDQILQTVADVTDHQNIVRAMVSDESSIGDFLTLKHRPKTRADKPVLYTEEEAREIVAKVAEELGIELDYDDKYSLLLVEVAKKLAGLTGE